MPTNPRVAAGYDLHGNLILLDPRASGQMGMALIGQSPDPEGPIGQAIQQDIAAGGQMLDLSGNDVVDGADIEIMTQIFQPPDDGGGEDPPPGGGPGAPGYLPRMARISYDYRNQMVKNVYTDYQEQSYVHSWHYDCFGRRFRKMIGLQPNGPATEWTTNGIAATGMQVRYIHGGRAEDGHWQVLVEYVGADNASSPGLSATYVYGNYIDEALTVRRDMGAAPPMFPGLPAMPTGNIVDFYFNHDDLFSTTSMAAGPGGIAGSALYPGSPMYNAGDIVESYDYGDFGHPKIGGSWWHSSIGNSRMFTGRDWEPEIEFYYYRTRYMEPMWGRFTSSDTIGVWGDAINDGNGVAYAGSNPSSFVDPFGLKQVPRPTQPSTLPATRNPAHAPLAPPRNLDDWIRQRQQGYRMPGDPVPMQIVPIPPGRPEPYLLPEPATRPEGAPLEKRGEAPWQKRNPGQTCPNNILDELELWKEAQCAGAQGAKCKLAMSCFQLAANKQNFDKCGAARLEVMRLCYDGSTKDSNSKDAAKRRQGHQQQIDQLRKNAKDCEDLYYEKKCHIQPQQPCFTAPRK